MSIILVLLISVIAIVLISRKRIYNVMFDEDLVSWGVAEVQYGK